MFTLFFEQPWMIGAIGTFLTIVTFYGWTQSGNSIALKTAIGLAASTVLLVLLNLWYLTDAETLRVWLAEAANEVQRNEFEKVRQRLSPDESERVANIDQRMRTVKFTVAAITRIHSIEINYNRVPPTAMVRMNVFVEAESHGVSAKIPRWIGLTLEKRNKGWVITDFEDRDAQHEFMKASAMSELIGD